MSKNSIKKQYLSNMGIFRYKRHFIGFFEYLQSLKSIVKTIKDIKKVLDHKTIFYFAQKKMTFILFIKEK